MLVDADFAGHWHKEYSELLESVLSRTGNVIAFCGCPVTWYTKLQSEITRSTTENEYVALSTAIFMKTIIWLENFPLTFKMRGRMHTYYSFCFAFLCLSLSSYIDGQVSNRGK
jgi:hypothetical protein